MAFGAAEVKQLRDKTGAGMMDCKKALSENNGDMEAAIDWLRTKGLAKAAKKSGRVAAEGLVGALSLGTKGVVVEVNSETDFVARNEQFQNLVGDILEMAKNGQADVEALLATNYPGADKTLENQLTESIATIGENMNLRRAAALEVTNGVVGSYIHNAVKPGLGKIAVLVALESTGDQEKLQQYAKSIAMHIAAVKPLALHESELDQELVERERAVQAEKARESGKPEPVIEKMLVGRMRKYFEEVVLMQQTYALNPDQKITDVLKEASKEAGAEVELKAFVRFELGDGIEKEESDFASEVAAAAGV